MTNTPMRLRAASRPAAHKSYSEDLFGTAGHLTWVIDGATNPDGDPRDTIAYTRTLACTLGQLAAETSSLRDMLAKAITAAARSAVRACDSAALPSAAIGIMRHHPDGTGEAILLGDITLTYQPAGTSEPVSISDDRLNSIATIERDRFIAATTDQSVSSAQRLHLRRKLVAAERACRNQPGGYWIASADPAAAAHALSFTLPPGTPALLRSDGADPAGHTDPARLLSDTSLNPAELLADIHASQLAAGQITEDATIVCMTSAQGTAD